MYINIKKASNWGLSVEVIYNQAAGEKETIVGISIELSSEGNIELPRLPQSVLIELNDTLDLSPTTLDKIGTDFNNSVKKAVIDERLTHCTEE